MNREPESRIFEKRIRRELSDVLAQFDISGKWTHPREKGGADYVLIGKRGQKTIVEIKHLSPLRYAELSGQMALALLQLRRSEKEYPNSRQLLVLVVPSLNERLKREVQTFIEEHFDLLETDVDWLILSEGGQYFGFFRGISRIGQVSVKGQTGRGSFFDGYVKAFSKHRAKRGRPSIRFTGNNQWSLKYLLLNGIESKYWGAPIFSGLWNSNTLKQQAGFNTAAQTHRLLLELEETDYLRKGGGQIEFRNMRQLLENWIETYRKQKHLIIPLAPLYSGESFDEWRDKRGKGWWSRFDEVAARKNITVLAGGHMGCFALGIGWSNNPSILFHSSKAHVPSLERFLREMELQVTENENSPIKLQLHNYEKPVLDVINFQDREPLRVVDIIQCVLDVSLMTGGRGEEQAKYILDRVLFPHFRRMGWSL